MQVVRIELFVVIVPRVLPVRCNIITVKGKNPELSVSLGVASQATLGNLL